jgi:hypothetical protein
MPIPGSRSPAESLLYMDLYPCACGEGEIQGLSLDLVEHPGLLATRRSGTCAGCGRLRTFVFGIPDERAYLAMIDGYGGPEPSALIDAGEWMFCGCVAALAGDGDLAAILIEEVAKFIEPGADRPPDDAFDSVDGQRVRDAMPSAFRAGRLADRARRYRRGALIGDEEHVPRLRRAFPDGRARNRLIEILMQRVRTLVGSYIVDGPPQGTDRHGHAVLLSPEVDLELVALLGPGTGGDELGTMLAAQLRYERFLAARSGPGRHELAEALRHYDALRDAAPDLPVPHEVETLLGYLDAR